MPKPAPDFGHNNRPVTSGRPQITGLCTLIIIIMPLP